jgi:hypothetical protein
MKNLKVKEYLEQYQEVGVLWFLQTAPGIFQAYWYGSLYVVIEGYRELGLDNPDIDQLLESPNVDHLRLFRNGTFHFQPELISEKLFWFWDSEDSVDWVKTLHQKLGQFIFDTLISQLPEAERPKFLTTLKFITSQLSGTADAPCN